MKSLILASLLLTTALAGAASADSVEQATRTSGKAFLSEPTFAVQPVFSGRGGRDIVTARDGRVLVFHGYSLRESADGGVTWSPPREVGPDAGGKVIVNKANGEILYIHAVAIGCGLGDAISLTRFFHQKHQQTPNAFRQAFR